MDCLTSDFETDPFWWIAAPRAARDTPDALPAQVDVAIVGSGVTGLNAARELARHGRKVLVLDSEALGIGASTRNAGHVGRVLKYEFSDLQRVYGTDTAVAHYQEMQAAYELVETVIQTESIACHYQKKGRIILAYSHRQLRLIEAEARLKKQHLGEHYEMLDRNGLAGELATDRFCGGVYLPDSAALHPGLYHAGLINAAQRQGVLFAPHTTVDAITRVDDTPRRPRFRISTQRGTLMANDVIVATNGYSKAGVPDYLKRRLIPFNAYMIAIRMPEGELDALAPQDRVYIDANINLFFFRRAPDNQHLLFGGRTGSKLPARLQDMGTSLLKNAHALLPATAGKSIARVWTGRCAGTFDLYPHIGEHQGIHYAAGYCFAGIPMGTYLGCKLAKGLLRDPHAGTVFRTRSFPTLPSYTGTPWFVPGYMKYCDWKDRRSGGRPPTTA